MQSHYIGTKLQSAQVRESGRVREDSQPQSAETKQARGGKLRVSGALQGTDLLDATMKGHWYWHAGEKERERDGGY